MKDVVLKGWMVALAIFVLMFGGIYLTIDAGYWATTRPKTPVNLASGKYDVADMRGSYTFAEIEEFFGVPAHVVFQAFRIPEEKQSGTFLIKDMKDGLFEPVVLNGEEIEVGTDLVRMFTALYAGLPYESEETTHLPESAIKILRQENTLDADQQAYWTSHTFQLVPAGEETADEAPPQAEASEVQQTAAESETSPSEEAGAETSSAVEIKGRTSLAELLEFGLTQEQFMEITGFNMPDEKAVKLKDFAETNGLELSPLRTQLLQAVEDIHEDDSEQISHYPLTK